MMRAFLIAFGLFPTVICLLLATGTFPNWDIPAGGIFLSVAIVLCPMIGALAITEPRRPPQNYSPGCKALLVWAHLVIFNLILLFPTLRDSAFHSLYESVMRFFGK
jgi:hypothetical protein